MSIKGILSVLFALVTVSACLSRGGSSGCGGPSPGSQCLCKDASPHTDIDTETLDQSTASRGTIRMRISKEPQSLLSMIDPDPSVRSIVDHNVYESLVRTSKNGRSISPELAATWIEDIRDEQFTFHLAPAARWHDGKPVTAYDVEFTFSRLLDPDSQAALRSEFNDIDEVQVLDDRTVVLRLDRPNPRFLFVLSKIPILPAHIFGRVPLAAHPAARAPIGSGPYSFVRWVPGKLIELVRSKTWHGTPVKNHRIEYRIVADHRVALDLFRRGDLDIVTDLPGGTKHIDSGSRLITYPLPRFEAWIYNTSRTVFKSSATRRAVGLLIDREVIRCSILGCRADLVEGPWPKEYVSSSTKLPFDPRKAKKLLTQEGWIDSDGDGIIDNNGVDFSFSLLLPDVGRDLERTATVVQGDLIRAGIDMRISTMSLSTYLKLLRTHRFDASVIAVPNHATFDPRSFFHSRAIDEGVNFGSFSDPETDKLLDRLQAKVDLRNRIDIIRKLDSRIRQEHPATFTFRPHGAAIVRNCVRGVRIRNGQIEERFLRLMAKAGETKPGGNR